MNAETELKLPVLLGSRGDPGESDPRYMELEPPSTIDDEMRGGKKNRF